jgi:hypothetical protein
MMLIGIKWENGNSVDGKSRVPPFHCLDNSQREAVWLREREKVFPPPGERKRKTGSSAGKKEEKSFLQCKL